MNTVIRRVRKMERYYDVLSEAVKHNASYVKENYKLKRMFRKLVKYYESGKWLADYERDERGELPPTLKRGVLSEDGVYNLLSDIEQVSNHI